MARYKRGFAVKLSSGEVVEFDPVERELMNLVIKCTTCRKQHRETLIGVLMHLSLDRARPGFWHVSKARRRTARPTSTTGSGSRANGWTSSTSTSPRCPPSRVGAPDATHEVIGEARDPRATDGSGEQGARRGNVGDRRDHVRARHAPGRARQGVCACGVSRAPRLVETVFVIDVDPVAEKAALARASGG